MRTLVGPAVCKRCGELYEMNPFTEEMFSVTIDESGRAHSFVTSSHALSSLLEATKKFNDAKNTRTEAERDSDLDMLEELLAREPVSKAFIQSVNPKPARVKRTRARNIDRSPVDIMSIVADRKRREAERVARKQEAESLPAEA